MWMTLWRMSIKQFITALIKFHIKYHSSLMKQKYMYEFRV